MSECLFCRIVSGELPADKVYEDDLILAFRDIQPVVPVHLLIVPKVHMTTLNDATLDEQLLLGHMLLTARDLAAKEGVSESGYRLSLNCNQEGGQTVYHLHIHLLAGQQLTHL